MKKKRTHGNPYESNRSRPGKPAPGYENRRQLTEEEAEITGFEPFYHIMTDRETGRVTFWLEISTGEYLRATGTWAEQEEPARKLEEYWYSLR